MDALTVRDLRKYTAELIRDAEQGKLAGMPQTEFIGHLDALRIPVARYGSQELDRESADFG